MQVQVYTVEEVANVLQLHKKTIIDWLESKELIGVYINSEWRILGEDLYEFLQRHKTEKEYEYTSLRIVKDSEK